MTDSVSSIIKQFCEKYKLSLPESALSSFDMLTDELVAYNAHTNLTAVREVRDIAIKHYADSLAGGMTGLFTPSKKVLDVGCGAGFPGLPLQIYEPRLSVSFLDSTEKKLKFTSLAAEKLGFSVTTLPMRAEEAAAKKEYREQFDIVVSRAMAHLPILLELCLPFVKVGGTFIAYKAAHSADKEDPESELSRSQKALSALGGKLEDILYYDLCDFYDGEDDDKKHALLVVKKVRPTPQNYPRRYPQILKKPL